MDNVVNEVVDEYYELIVEDKKYSEKYKRDTQTTIKKSSVIPIEKGIVDNFLRWKMIKNRQDIINMINEDDWYILLRVQDYYIEILNELLYNYLGEDIWQRALEDDNENERIWSNEHLEKILIDKNASQEIKECIKIYSKACDVCKKFYQVMTNNK